MLCKFCGYTLNKGDKFCTNCGKLITDELTEEPKLLDQEQKNKTTNGSQSKEVELLNEGKNLNKEIIKDDERIRNLNTDIGSRKSNFTMEYKVKKRESTLGILSLLFSIFTVISLVILIVLAFVLPTESSSSAEEEIIELTWFTIIFITLSLDIIAIGLGIAGIVQRSRSRLMAFFGTIISVATLIILLSMAVLALL